MRERERERTKLGALGIARPAPYIPRAETDMGQPSDPTEILPVIWSLKGVQRCGTQALERSREDFPVPDSSAIGAPSELGSADKEAANSLVRLAHGTPPEWTKFCMDWNETGCLTTLQSAITRAIQQGVDQLIEKHRTLCTIQQPMCEQCNGSSRAKSGRTCIKAARVESQVAQRISVL